MDFFEKSSLQFVPMGCNVPDAQLQYYKIEGSTEYDVPVHPLQK